MNKNDPKDILGLFFTISQQLEYATSEKFFYDINPDEFDSILFVGMGGSGVAARIIAELFNNKFKTPWSFSNDYLVPEWISEKSLVVSISQSGNTEEVYFSTEDAYRKNAKIIIITSGGNLEILARKLNCPIIKIPPVIAPRGAFGNLFGTLLNFLKQMKVIDVETKEIEETIALLEELKSEWTKDDSLPWRIARYLEKSYPMIYGEENYMNSICFRWVTQLNENAGILAHFAMQPEMSHNEIVGWRDKSMPAKILFLCGNQVHPRIALRREIMKKIIPFEYKMIFPPSGLLKWQEAFYFLHLGDIVSVYLAYINNKDPFDINEISCLKMEMGKK
ncbi:MAG: bifunctional phosphoglucose/phosphomannose isomerase [Candidatus Coatesbacteria bacterium]|nr:bifunctional phosphoglucose/phosphomannose isomerase [Candidatus Coatesbacteria bacterium]